MKSYKYLKRKIKKFQKPEKRTNRFVRAFWFKCILSIIIFLIFSCVVHLLPKFENEIKGNENWAVALIAIPIALLGIYISILLPLLRKNNSRVLGTTIKEIHNQTVHIADYQSTVWCYIALTTVFWVHYFVSEDYNKMIAMALYLSVCFIYLITYSIWLYSQDPVEAYCDSIIKLKIEKSNIFKNIETVSQKVVTTLSDKQIEEVDAYISKVYSKTFDTIDQLFIEILSGENKEQAVTIFKYVLNELKEFQFSELNTTILYKISSRFDEISDELLQRKEFLFLSNISNLILLITANYIKNATKEFKDYVKFMNNAIVKRILKEDDAIEFANDSLPILYKHSYYYKVFCNINNSLISVVSKSKTQDNFLTLFNNYNIETSTFEQITSLLNSYNEDVQEFITLFQKVCANSKD